MKQSSLHDRLLASKKDHLHPISEGSSTKDTLLNFYNEELRDLHNEARHFSQKHPEVAHALGLEENSVTDPMMNHLMQSFAFMGARLQQQAKDGQNKLIKSLLKLSAPHLEHPYPAMSIVQLTPKSKEGLELIPKGSPLILKSKSHKISEFMTGYSTQLNNIEILKLGYEPSGKEGLLKLMLKNSGASPKNIRFFINLPLSSALKLHGHFFENLKCFNFRSENYELCLKADSLKAVGFLEDDCLLHYPGQVLEGHKLCNEFFAYPWRFLFFELDLSGGEISPSDLMYLEFHFYEYEAEFSSMLSERSLVLNCVPIINRYKQMAEPILASDKNTYPLLLNNNHSILTHIEKVQALTKTGDELNFHPLFYTEASKLKTPYWELNRLAVSDTLNEQYSLKIHTDKTDLRLLHVELYCCDQNAAKEIVMQETHSLIFKHSSLSNSISIRALTELTEYRAALIHSSNPHQLAKHLNINYLLPEEETLDNLLALMKLYNQHQHPALDILIEAMLELNTSKETSRGMDGSAFVKKKVCIKLTKKSIHSFHLMKKLIQTLLADYSLLEVSVETRS